MTFATSLACGAFAGWGTISSSTSPPEATVDGWRGSAYDMICSIIGEIADNSRGTAAQIEKELVKIEFMNHKNGSNYEMALSASQIERLQAAFRVGFGLDVWIPGLNT